MQYATLTLAGAAILLSFACFGWSALALSESYRKKEWWE